jgi:hypothetical protein
MLTGFSDILLSAYKYNPENIESYTTEQIRDLFITLCDGINKLYGNWYPNHDYRGYMYTCLEPIMYQIPKIIPEETSKLFKEREIVKSQVHNHNNKVFFEALSAELSAINKQIIESIKDDADTEIAYRILFDNDIDIFLEKYPTICDGDAILIDFYRMEAYHM